MKIEDLEKENEDLANELRRVLMLFDRGLGKYTIGRRVCDDASAVLKRHLDRKEQEKADGLEIKG